MRTTTLLLLASISIATALPVACSSAEGTPEDLGPADADAGDAEADSGYSSVRLEPADAKIDLPLGGSVSQSYKVFGTRDGAESEITSTCALSFSDPTFGAFSGAKATIAAHGGDTDVTAVCDGAVGTAKLHVRLTGKLVAEGAPEGADATFAAAKPGTDDSKKPVIEYPFDGAVAPVNVPPIEVQWKTGGSDLFHVALRSPTVAVDWYGTSAEAMLTEKDWRTVAASAAGGALAITVAGLATAAPDAAYESAPVSLTMSHDRIDNTAIYYWASSTGNLMTQVFGNTGEPSSVRGDCTSCHSVSRSGTRVGYSRCVGGDCGQLFQGFLKYDADAKSWVDTMNANDKKVAASYSTFSPVGYPYKDDEQALALIALAGGKLQLWDPDKGAAIPSNAEDVSSESGARSATMPDWSPDGKTIVFASTPTPGQHIDVSQSAIATMSYSFDGTNHTFGAPKKIVEGPLTFASGTYDNFFFPSWSADGKLVVFNAARKAWRQFDVASAPGQRLALTDATGSFKVELAKMNGEGDMNVTWPHWAPGAAADYHWVVFSSERPYGHRMDASKSPAECKQNGVQSCKQIWIGAIAKSKIGSGEDPSAPPIWMPGQTLGANNISPYWTLPAGSIAK